MSHGNGFDTISKLGDTCQMCKKSRVYFHCHVCLTHGAYKHNSWKDGESFSDKQSKYFALNGKLNLLKNSYDEAIEPSLLVDSTRASLRAKRNRLQILRKALAELTFAKQLKCDELKRLRRSNDCKRKQHENFYGAKIQTQQDFHTQEMVKLQEHKDLARLRLDELKRVRAEFVRELAQHIFPIRRFTTPRDAGCSAEHRLVWKVLLKARPVGALCQIVEPTLPAHGNYAAYNKWLKDDNDEQLSSPHEAKRNRIVSVHMLAALSFAAQYAELLAKVLGICLPQHVSNFRFSKRLSEKQYRRAVTQLNANILQLCYTQNVRVDELKEAHTIENLAVLVNPVCSDIGRSGCNNPENAPTDHYDDSMLLAFDITTDSSSEASEDLQLRSDWEDVRHFDLVPNEPPAVQRSTIAGAMINTLLRLIK